MKGRKTSNQQRSAKASVLANPTPIRVPHSTHNNSVSAVEGWLVLYAALAGTFGALSGICGKLSVTSLVDLEWYVRFATFGGNAVCTAQMWRYYLKALSLGPTPVCQVLNTGTNFAVSALFGVLFFEEQISTLWCVGAAMVVLGLGIIVADPNVPKS